MNHVFDATFNGQPRSEMYRSWLFPDLFPHEQPALVHQWGDDDKVMYCGGQYAKNDYEREQ